MKGKSRTVISLILIVSMFLPTGTGGSGREAAASVAVRESGTSYTDTASGYTYVLFEKTVSGKEEDDPSVVTMAEITAYTGSDWNLSIPASVPDPAGSGAVIPVGKIGAQAFMENPDVTSVIIPEGVETIGFRAFYGCENLKKVSIPASVTSWDCGSGSIESGAFRDCTGLTELTLSDGLEIIGGYAFSGCTALESVRLPSHLNDFYDEAFSDCSSLHDLELPEGITEIGKRAFRNCISLTEVQIPSTIQRWNYTKYSNIMAPDYVCAAFAGCTSLAQVTFAEGLTTLSCSNLFPDCTALKSVTVPSSVRRLTRAFEGCNNLEEIILYDGLETIEEYAFRNCSALRKCRIPSTVRSIENYAFQGCSSLETIVCPENMTRLGAAAFSGCTKVQSLYFLTESLEYCAEILPNSSAMVYCPARSTTWQKCLERLQQSGKEEQLAALPEIEGIQAAAYDGDYDGSSHPAFRLTGIQSGDQLSCWTLASNGTLDQYINGIPQVTEPGNSPYLVVIQRNSSTGLPVLCSRFWVTSVVRKKAPIMVFGKLQFEEQTDYVAALEQYNGESTVTYRYYRDAECQKRLSSKPRTPGTYYIVAVSAESQHYLAGQSEPAELIISETVVQPPEGSQPPGSSGKPSETQSPEASEKPSETQSPEASEKPSETQSPEASERPSGTQSPEASGKPSETQSPEASERPSGSQPPESSGKPSGTQSPGSSGNPSGAQSSGNSGGSLGANSSRGSNGGSGKLQKPNSGNGGKVQMKKVSLRKVRSPRKKTLQLRWKKTAGVSGYQVCIALNQKMKKGKRQITVKGASNTGLTIQKLKSRKKYYVRIRAYQIIQGKKHYGNWSKIKKKRVK